MENIQNQSRPVRLARWAARIVRNTVYPSEAYKRVGELTRYIGTLPVEHGVEQFKHNLHEANRMASLAEFRHPFTVKINTGNQRLVEGTLGLLRPESGEVRQPRSIAELLRHADMCDQAVVMHSADIPEDADERRSHINSAIAETVLQAARTESPWVCRKEGMDSRDGVYAYAAPTRLPHVVAALSGAHLLKNESPRLDSTLTCQFFYVPPEILTEQVSRVEG